MAGSCTGGPTSAGFGFKGSDQQKKVGDLSGGERNRVHLAKVLRSGGNVLLLDEPTNDLDVDTLRALEDALLAFPVARSIISHDRWFLDRIATHVLAFEGRLRGAGGGRGTSPTTKPTGANASVSTPTNLTASSTSPSSGTSPDMRVRAFAPGRVNLIGDHTDYTGGFVLPMAVHLGTTVEAERRGDEVRLTSDQEPGAAVIALDQLDPQAVEPSWARYIAGVVAEVRPKTGLRGRVRSTLPLGAGLSSSASLEVAVACALGFDGTPLELAQACQRAEQRASGVPCGIMDQLTSAAGRAGHALLIDCSRYLDPSRSGSPTA